MKRINKQTRDWFSVQSAANGEPAEVFIYDEIGAGFFSDGVTPDSLIKQIKALKLKNSDQLNVRINSPGGNMFDGNTIYNYLRSIKNTIVVTIDGLAASAASVIAMAGDTVRMPENSFLMIHNPWMFVAGDANTMRKMADDLDEMRDGAVKTYQSKVGDKLSRDEIITMLDDETWLIADKAIELGFADELIEPVRAAALARFDLSNYEHVPEVISKMKKHELAHMEKLRAALQERKTSQGPSTA